MPVLLRLITLRVRQEARPAHRAMSPGPPKLLRDRFRWAYLQACKGHTSMDTWVQCDVLIWMITPANIATMQRSVKPSNSYHLGDCMQC